MKKFIGGMVKDPERVDQPEGSYRDALNANLYYLKGAVVNEQGTSPIVNVGSFTIDNIIGQCPLTDGRIVLFFNYTFQGSSTSAISIVNTSLKENTIIYRDAQLNFQAPNTIEATTKIDVNGNVLVYFTDNYILKETDPFTNIEYISDYNPPRVINITRQETSTNVSRLYGNADYTVTKLDLFMNAGFIPEFTNIKIEEGGGVVSGTYHLALAYVDEDLNRTNYLATSNPVHLVTAQEDAIPTEVITGDPQGSQSNKSITWTVDIPLPSNYTHVRPVIIQRFGGGTNQESSEFAYELEIVKIPATAGASDISLDITYTGLEQVAASAISEIVIDSVRYETAKSFVQLDNRLYISNLRARGDIGYQRYANSIKIIPTVRPIPKFDPKRIHSIVLNNGYANYIAGIFNNDFNIYKDLQEDDLADGFFASNVRKGYKDVKMSHEYKGYRRSEVYAFYISFVLNDGSETYAYHIPGRAPKDLPRASSGNVNVTETSTLTETVLTAVADSEINLQLSEIKDLYPDTRMYQITDTQYIDSENSQEMSYWENEDEKYPDSPDFDVLNVTGDGSSVEVGDLKNKKVRHHKMPPNKNEIYSFINTLDGGGEVFPNLFGQNADQDGLILQETIKILGVTLTDISIPQFIRDQVQGFKVYYAKRQQQEKTIIGQSAVLPSWYEDEIAITNRMTNAVHGSYVDAWFLKGMLPYGPNLPSIKNIPGLVGKARKALSVFTFHDFNLLKNKHTLSGASHIDVQKILTMRMYHGGNKKQAGDNKPYMIDTDWINVTIGNTQWYEWTNPSGGGDDYNAVQAVTVTDPDDTTFASLPGVTNYYTSVLVATRYHNPNYVNSSFADSTINSWFYTSNREEYGYWLNNYQTVLALESNSKTYITGSTLLKNSESGAFKNADYLMHFAGESCMAFGLVSGLPALLEHRNYPIPLTVASSAPYRQRTQWWTQAKWSSATNPSGNGSNYELAQLNALAHISNPGSYASWPTVYLVNLCSYKTNVYKPFDQQRLVWTGYYQALDEARTAGARQDDENPYVYKTDTVFGGDTFVNRHSFRSTSQDYGANFYRGPSNGAFSIGLTDVGNWATNPYRLHSVNGSNQQPKYRPVDPYATVFNFYCESDDLLGFRHQGDTSEGVTVPESMFLDASTGADVLFSGPDNDQTKSEHLLYMNNYSAVQDIKVTSPLPKKLFNPTLYPTRTIRSTVDDGSIQDKYRFFLSLDYKDIPRNRGEITKLFTLGSILYLHTERSLFVTRGRQQLGLSDNTQAFVGSGDIFEQSPDEMIPTTEGYGGTDCQFASLTTRFGQFFVNRKDRKVYLMGESIQELSSLGMEKWFLDNIPYKIQTYIDLENAGNLDAPTHLFGFNAVYDPKYKRIILSKRELLPTGALLGILTGGYSDVQIDLVTETNITISGSFPSSGGKAIFEFSDTSNFRPAGWTMSYYPELKVWGSRHSYLPNLFANTQKEYYGLVNTSATNVWEHSDLNNPGKFYDTQYNFEVEYIDNSQVGIPKIFTAIRYWAEVVGINGVYPDMSDKHTSPAFTSFYTYNSTQLSGARDIYYLTNARLVDRFWYINDFRDLSAQTTNTAAVIANNQLNVHDVFNVGSTTSLTNRSMFIEEGVINPAYLDTTKQWYNHKKFVDHFLGVRLISDNLERNLIYLYSAGTKFRQSFR